MDEKENFLGSAGEDQIQQRIPLFLNISPCKPLRSLIVPKKKMVCTNLRNCKLCKKLSFSSIYISTIECEGHKEVLANDHLGEHVVKWIKPGVYNQGSIRQVFVNVLLVNGG